MWSTSIIAVATLAAASAVAVAPKIVFAQAYESEFKQPAVKATPQERADARATRRAEGAAASHEHAFYLGEASTGLPMAGTTKQYTAAEKAAASEARRQQAAAAMKSRPIYAGESEAGLPGN